MTTDITSKFEEAAKNARTWTHASVQDMVQAICTVHPGAWVDWESGDEEWARVIEAEGDDIIAFVCAKFPVGFIRGEGRPAGDQPFVWISVPSTDAPVFSIRPQVLEQLFGRSVSQNPDYDRISADEIWWATVS